MKLSNLKILVALSALFAYAASAAFYQQNGGMVVQQTAITAAAGTTTLVATSNQVQIVEGATTQTVKLPSAITLPLNWHYDVINNSTGAVTVTDNAGTTLATLQAGRPGRFFLTARGSAAGTWKVGTAASVTDLSLYYLKTEHISTSTGGADAGKPIVLNGSGLIDSTMLPSGLGGWGTSGNNGLVAGTNFLGTTDAVDLVFKTNNAEVMRLTSAGLIDTGLTGSRVVITDASGGLTVATMDSALLVVTGTSIQEQLDGKEPSFTTLPVADGGTGTSTQFTLGSAIFAGASGVYAQDNANYFYDDTNNRLGVGTASPTYRIHLEADADDYAHGMAIANSDAGSANALWNLYTDRAGPFVIRNPNQAVAPFNLSHLGNVSLSGAALSTGRSVGVQNISGENSDVTLALTKLSAQTANIISVFATDNSSVLASVDSGGSGTFVDLTLSSFPEGAIPVTGSGGTQDPLRCATSGHAPIWNGSTFACAAPATSAPVVNTYTANQTLTESNQDVYCNVATSDMVITLYSAASGTRKPLNIKNISQTGTCTIRPTSTAQAIFEATGNEAELILAPGGTAVNLRPDGSSVWYVH